MTRSAKGWPYLVRALFRAVISFWMLVVPEAQMPSRIDVLVSMAASKAWMGSLVE